MFGKFRKSSKKEEKKEEPVEINYNWLKNKNEREIALNTILTSLKWRITTTEESLRKGVVLNNELQSTASIIKEFESICTTIWNDDLHNNNTYLHLLIKFASIGKNPFPIPITEISDEYLKTETSSEFNLKLVSNGKVHQMKIRKGTYLDYSFIKLILRATNSNESKGKYYLIYNEQMETGYSFIYLDEPEFNTIQKNKVLKLTELTEKVVDEINLWAE